MSKLKGIYCAMLTPFYPDGSINYDEAKRLARFLVDNGLDGIFPVSSIGEGIHFSVEESVNYYKAVYETVGTECNIIPGATTSSTYNVIKLMKAYQEVGCNCAVIAPLNYTAKDEDDVIKHYEEIINQTGCEIVAYDAPLFALEFTDKMLDALIKNPNVIGIKDSTGSGINMLKILNEIDKNNSDTSVMIGRDELLVQSLKLGVDGCMLGGASVLPEYVVAIKKAVDDNDMEKAMKLQYIFVDAIKAMFALPFPLGFKLALEHRGFKMGATRKIVDTENTPNYEQKCQDINRYVDMCLDAIK